MANIYKVILPKRCGGLGFRQARDSNEFGLLADRGLAHWRADRREKVDIGDSVVPLPMKEKRRFQLLLLSKGPKE